MDGIRRFEAGDWEDSIALSQFAFQYELSEQEKEERRALFNPQASWGYFVDGKLAAKVSVLPLKMWIQGKVFAMGGIASVASWPEYRRQGMVGRLLAHTLQVMREEGQTVSSLAPFSFAFYRKYGWEAFVERKKYEVSVRKLPVFPPYEGRIARVSPDEWRLLNGMYETYAAAYNGMLQRDETWWRERVLKGKKGTIAVYYNEREEPRGYLIYRVKDKHLQAHEIVFLDEQARKALWKFIANHDSMIEKVTLLAPADDRLAFLFEDPRIRQETEIYFMARIVDVKRFIERYPFAARNAEWRFRLRVEDRYAPWNDGVFAVAVDGEGRAAVDACGAGEGLEPDLHCDVQTLTALLLGYQQAGWLRQIGRLRGSAESAAMLEAIVPGRTTYLMDSF